MKSQYLRDVRATVEKRNPGEPEFIQAVTEVLESLEPVIEAVSYTHLTLPTTPYV